LAPKNSSNQLKDSKDSQDSLELIRIPQNCVKVTWPFIVQYVFKPLKKLGKGEKKIEDVYESLLNGHQELWVLVDKDIDSIIGMCTTQVIKHPQYNVLGIPLVGTDPHTIDKWYNLTMSDTSPLIAWAKENKAVRIEGYIRDGWLKFVKNYDFKKYYTVITKEV